MHDVLKPRWQTAVALTVLFFFTQFTLSRIIGIDFEEYTDTTDNTWKGITLRVGITATIFTLIALWARKAWNGGVYVQHVKPPLPRWMWSIPILMVVLAVVKFAANDWGERGGEYMVALALGVLFVGIAEETTFRGLNVRAMRGSTSNEFIVMAATSVLFGVVHGVNILNGAKVGNTLGQIALATLGGGAFYITLRLTGSVLVPILLHAFWDYPILGKVGDANAADAATLLGQIVAYGLVVYAAVVIRRSSHAEEAPAVQPVT